MNKKPLASYTGFVIRHSLFVILTLVLAVPGCGGVEQNPTTPTALSGIQPKLLTCLGQMHFVRDVDAGYRLAEDQGLPCLMFFTADWCTYCQEMEEAAFADPTVAQMSESFVCVLVDADRETEICGQFSVSVYPTIQFVSSRGQVLNRLVGRQSAPELMVGMRSALKRFAWLNDSATKLR